MTSRKLEKIPFLKIPLKEARKHLEPLSPQKRLTWAYEQFGPHLAITTSFGIQSSVLLHMLYQLNSGNTIKVIWVDTGYLPKETYQYAAALTDRLKLDVTVAQSIITPARMEALYGELWNTNSLKDMGKYHRIRKVEPLEKALEDLDIYCWASGVRSSQTDNRSSMSILDRIRNRLSLRPILEWSQKDIFYYMQTNDLPQHPLFEKGYSTIGDWHSSSPDTTDAAGRKTRFGGLQQECGIHIEDSNKEHK
ncbi:MULTISPECIES: phosphoadenylyl-sulfate reductase [Prochlorococcus]|nr:MULTISPECIES: phosphoadenylyl-sulfate reductase [Prochlorococcus]KGG35447.1 Phosphoadenylyl-sulfate reductase (thioredoxin) [Prochlorococcus sp. SS52]